MLQVFWKKELGAHDQRRVPVLAGVEQLMAAQRERLQQVAQEQGDEAASLAAIELRRWRPRAWTG